ncbi:MAG: tRNA lysidine(34) synthetase TilS [Nitrospirae bacterium]|nr:tRNA lysidine(34) synthetase TilS [Nitrospirota bacterium]
MKSSLLVVEEDFVRFLPRESRELSHKTCDQVTETSLAVPGHVVWARTGQTIRAQEVSWTLLADTSYGSSVVVDADRLSGSLVVRGWQPGDRFHPLGMKGQSKKLQDFFTDLKVPIAARKRIPVVAAPEGIVWIVGYRQDERWACTAATKRCLVITASKESRSESARKGS